MDANNQGKLMRKKYAEIHKQISDICCAPAENDHEFFLNLLIAQRVIQEELYNFSDLAFMEWKRSDE